MTLPGEASTTAESPCIVLGLETQIGLAAVRELGRAGVPVIGVTHDPRAIGLASRYLAQGVVVSAPRSEALLDALRGLGRRHGPCSLIAVSESNLSWLTDRRDQLGDVRAAVPGREQLALVLDKGRTLAAAREVGVRVPEGQEPTTYEEALALAERLPYPVVLKWSDSGSIAPRLAALGLPWLKAEYVHDPAGWRTAVDRYRPLGRWPLVQAYAAGCGLGQFFFMHGGQAVRRFQHLRVAEWPPEGGFSSVCDAEPLDRHVELQQRSIALLQRIGWQGVAMVEYRWDAASGEATLMEINGRLWGSFPLAVQAGAGFALFMHRAALGLPLPELPAPRSDIRCRMVSTEIKRLVRIAWQAQRIADPHFARRPWREFGRFFGDFARSGVGYYVWSRDDPRPWYRDLSNALRRR